MSFKQVFIMWFQQQFTVNTSGRGTTNITRKIEEIINLSGISTGLCHVFLQHTSASLMLCENADPDVRVDLESFISRLIPDGDPVYRHTLEGPDDMPAHVRTVLTHSDMTFPVTNNRSGLGIWQGVFLWEHRHAAHSRSVTVTINGE